MIGLIKELTDTFSMSEWNVVWIDDEGNRMVNVLLEDRS